MKRKLEILFYVLFAAAQWLLVYNGMVKNDWLQVVIFSVPGLLGNLVLLGYLFGLDKNSDRA